ncbi:unnamed protein product [Trichobilharzia szidati]|nr:unnamed protein product [Trichobilharzia szidati]
MANIKSKVLKQKDSGKCSMRTAMDVVKRVLWDEMIPQESITIGYLDRFKGIIEKPFDAFSWEPLDSLDYFTFGVPEHRIQYFKYKDLVVWDKRFRLDRVFGSSRSTKTIRDVIEKYEKYCKVSENVPDILLDNKNGGVSFRWSLESLDDSRLSETQTEESMDDTVSEKSKQRPNFFICQRIESPIFIEKAKKIQSHICSSQPLYKDCCLDAKLFHLTLLTVRLEDSSQISKCMEALKQSEMELHSCVPKDQLTIKGVNSFRGRVIYAAVELDASLELFVNQLNKILQMKGFQTDDQRKFTPHVTLMKVTRSVFKKTGEKKVEPNLYSEFADMEFGKQPIDSIHLCAIGKPHDVNGFYRTFGNIDFSNQTLKSE